MLDRTFHPWKHLRVQRGTTLGQADVLQQVSHGHFHAHAQVNPLAVVKRELGTW